MRFVARCLYTFEWTVVIVSGAASLVGWTSFPSGHEPAMMSRNNPKQDLSLRGRTGFVERAATRRSLCRGKQLVICIKWKLVHSSGPQFSSSVPSTCELAEIRDQTLKKSNELQIREWEQVPLNKRDHDLQPRIGNVEQVKCLDLRA